MFVKNEIYTLDDNNDYIVGDAFEMDGNNYAYFINMQDPKKVICAKINNDDISVMTDEEELKKFLEKASENI
ncbi:MAG: hypothetical protein J6O56_02130 [Bacilli bacterium]|nr:hypothetical protein [Bacilli bacterium]